MNASKICKDFTSMFDKNFDITGVDAFHYIKKNISGLLLLTDDPEFEKIWEQCPVIQHILDR